MTTPRESGQEPPEADGSGARPGLGAEHDPLGLDVARQVAQRTSSGLPPARTGPKRRPFVRRSITDGLRSGAGPDARDPQLVGDVVDRLVDGRGWRRELKLRTLLESWAELVGPVNAAHSTAEAYADGVLIVRAEATVWASSLRTLAPQLVAELNRRLGEGTVTRIIVKGPAAPSWKHGRRSVRDGRGPRDTYG